MRSFNFRLFAVLVVCAAVLGAGVHALHEHQVAGHTSLFLKLADDAKTRGDAVAEADNLRRYLQLERDDVAVLERYGLLLADNGRVRDAVTPLMQVVNQEKEDEAAPARRRLIELLLRLGRYDEADAQIQSLWKEGDELAECVGEDQVNQAKLRLQRGMCKAGQRQWAAAMELWKEAIALDPRQIEAYEWLALALANHSESPQTSEAIAQLNAMVESNPEDFRSYLVRGRFLKEHVDDQDVQEHVCEAVPENPDAQVEEDLQPQQRQGYVLAAAFRDALRAVELAPALPSPNEGGGGASTAAREAAAAQRERFAAVLFAAECANAVARVAAVLPETVDYRSRAHEFANQAKEIDPRSPQPYAILAEGEVRAADPSRPGTTTPRARQILRDGLRHTPLDPTLLWMLASLELSEHRLDEAQELMGRLKRTEGAAPLVRYLQARVLIDQSKWADAARLLESTRSALKDWPDLRKEACLWLAVSYGKLGQRDQQLRAFEEAGKIDPFWLPALVGEAEATLAAGRFNEAIELYKQAAVQSHAPPGVQITYCRLVLLAGLKQPSQINWGDLRGQLQTIREREETSLEQRREVDVLTAESLAVEGDLDAAEEHLAAAIASDPDAIGTRVALAGVQQRRQQLDRAEATLRGARERLGDSAAWRVAQARYLVNRDGGTPEGRAQITPEILALAEFPTEWSDADVIHLAGGMYPVVMSLGERTRGEELQQEIADRDPSNLNARLALFDFALQSRDASRIKAILDEVRGIAGEGPEWRYGNAVLLVLMFELDAAGRPTGGISKSQRDRLQAALSELSEARKASPQWFKITLLQARILDLLGMRDEALAAYQNAVQLGAREPQAVVRLVRLHLERGELEAAAGLLTRVINPQQVPVSLPLAAAASDLSVLLGAGEQAQDLARMSLAIAEELQRDSTSFEDHLLYGEILRQQGQLVKAEAALIKARSLAPQELAPWHCLVRLYAQTQRPDDVSRLLGEAEASFGRELGPLAVAQAYQLLQDLPRAEAQFAQAVADAPNSARVLRAAADFYIRQGKGEQAQPLLARLSEGSADGGSAADLRWGRRSLSLLLGGGTRREWEAALQLIELNLADGEATPEDQRMKALILSVRATQPMRDTAIALLEGIIQNSPAPLTEDRFLLARLHLDSAKWLRERTQPDPDGARERKAREQFNLGVRTLQQILARDQEHPRALALYATALVDNGQLATARSQLPKLSELTGQTECLEAALYVLRADGRLAEAYELLEKLVPVELTPESAPAMLRAATLLARFGASLDGEHAESAARFLERAEQLYRGLADADPQYGLALAGFFGNRGRSDEALALIEQHAAGANPLELVGACVVTIQGTEDRRRLRNRMDAALVSALEGVEDEESIPLRLTRADLRAWTGDPVEAEQMYREVLELKPRHVMAANNLAFLLAWQGKDLEEAERWIETAIEEQGEQPELLDTRACVRLQLGRPGSAVADLEQAMQEADDVAFAYHLARAELARAEEAGENRALAETARNEALVVWNAALAAGLETDRLHPIEREGFRQFRSQVESLK